MEKEFNYNSFKSNLPGYQSPKDDYSGYSDFNNPDPNLKAKQDDCQPKIEIESGGVNEYRPRGLNSKFGIDVTLKIACVKGGKSIRAIQVAVVSNDDDFTEEDAKSQGLYISSDNMDIGFVDPRGQLFYYTSDERNKLRSYGDYRYNSSTGEATFRFVDSPKVLIENPYILNRFVVYIVKIGHNNTLQVLGKIKHYYAKDDGQLKLVAGKSPQLEHTNKLSDTVLKIISADKKAALEFAKYKIVK